MKESDGDRVREIVGVWGEKLGMRRNDCVEYNHRWKCICSYVTLNHMIYVNDKTVRQRNCSSNYISWM